MNTITLELKLKHGYVREANDIFEKYHLPHVLEIYGFLTAVISGPNLVVSSEWINYLGINNIRYESTEEMNFVVDTLLALYHQICRDLSNKTFRVLNLVNPECEYELDTAIDLWAKGYLRGVAFAKAAWLMNGEVSALLFPIVAIRMSDKPLQQWFRQNNMNIESKNLKKYSKENLSETAVALYKYWHQQIYDDKNTALYSNKITPNREDACFCGSGKKFKKCCSH